MPLWWLHVYGPAHPEFLQNRNLVPNTKEDLGYGLFWKICLSSSLSIAFIDKVHLVQLFWTWRDQCVLKVKTDKLPQGHAIWHGRTMTWWLNPACAAVTSCHWMENHYFIDAAADMIHTDPIWGHPEKIGSFEGDSVGWFRPLSSPPPHPRSPPLVHQGAWILINNHTLE